VLKPEDKQKLRAWRQAARTAAEKDLPPPPRPVLSSGDKDVAGGDPRPVGAGHKPLKDRAASRADRARKRAVAEAQSDDSGTVAPPWVQEMASLFGREIRAVIRDELRSAVSKAPPLKPAALKRRL